MVNNTAVNQNECALQSLLLQLGNFCVVKDLSASYFRKEGFI